VILCDTNLLVCAWARSMPQHAAARRWLEETLNSGIRVGMPWPVLLGFARLASNPRIFPRAIRIAAAWQVIESWLDNSNVWIPAPGDRHRELLSSLLPHTAGNANLIADAHLAALAIEHGPLLCSVDGDFARFPGLRWKNPLA
jgi:uncharacterized protein